MSTNLSEICVYNAKLANKEFVGIFSEDGNLKVYFPLGYKEENNDIERRKSILNLIAVLGAFSDSLTANVTTGSSREIKKSFPIQAYLRIISDFYTRGYYYEVETNYKKSNSGHISWDKTFKKIQPSLDKDSFVYLDFIARKTQNNENALITLIHKFFVYDAFLKLGFLFSTGLPEKPPIRYNPQLFRSLINQKISKTYNHKNLILFNDMKTIMNYLDSSDDTGNFCYGTEEFEYVWEKLVDYVYGIPNKADYYPHTEWHIGDKVYDDGDVDYKKNALRPDTIMVIEKSYKKEIFVLDSKYYKYGEMRNVFNLPNTGSITKQIAYGKYVELNACHPELRVDGNRIYNAFILPFNSKDGSPIEVFGYAKTTYETNDKTFHKIYGVLIDTRELLLHHPYRNAEKIKTLADTIKAYMATNNS